jgi:hypothetical protein
MAFRLFVGEQAREPHTAAEYNGQLDAAIRNAASMSEEGHRLYRLLIDSIRIPD